MAFRPISRRTALKGLGVSIALPFLEAMRPVLRAAEPLTAAGAKAASAGAVAAGAASRRLVFLYFPNGVKTEFWNSTGEGKDYQLGKTLAALEPFKKDMIVFSNLADANARGGGA